MADGVVDIDKLLKDSNQLPDIGKLFPHSGGQDRYAPRTIDEIRKQTEQLKAQAQEYGISEGDLQPRESAFGIALNAIDKPKQITMGLAKAALTGGLYQDGIQGTIDKSLEERTNAFDILREAGIKSPIRRALLGLPLEILFDPLTYTGIGTPRSATKAGTRALTELGLKELNDFRKTVDEIGPIVGGIRVKSLASSRSVVNEKLADEVFGSAGEYVKLLDKAKATSSPARKTLLKSQAEMLVPKFEPYLGLNEDGLRGLFRGRELEFSMSVPFLGYFKDGTKSAEFISDLPELASKAKTSKAAGIMADIENAIKPVKFSKSVSIEPVANVVDNIKMSLAQELFKLKTAPTLSVAGKAVIQGEKVARALTDTIGSVFSADWFLGKRTGALAHDYANYKEAVKRSAQTDTVERFKNWMTPEKEMSRRRAAMFYDGMAESTLTAFFNNPKRVNNFARKFKALIRDTKDYDPEAAALLASEFKNIKASPGIDGLQEIDFDAMGAAMKLGRISEDERGMILAAQKGFREMRERELAHGVETKFLDYYIPHLVERAKDAFKQRGNANSFFLKEREYATFGELLKDAGLNAKTDIAEIYLKRKAASDSLILNKQMFEKMVVNHAIDAKKIGNIYRDALNNPDSYAALKTMGFATPSVETADLMNRLENLALGKDAGVFVGQSTIRDAKKMNLTPDEQIVLLNSINSVRDQVETKAMALGLTEKERNIPIRLGSPGVLHKINGREYFVPPAIDSAIRNVLQTKDFVKAYADKSPIGSMVLKWADAAANWGRRTVTLPFPSYWSQNGLGNIFLSMADSIEGGLSPLRAIETHGLLKGEHGLRVAGGRVIDPQAFRKILEENAIRFTAEDFASIIDTAGKLDLDTFIRKQKSWKQNLSENDVVMAWDKMTEGFQYVFEDFMRINQLANELRKGSAIPDAVRSMNDVMLNYRALSSVESSLFRRLYLFYPWTKQATAKSLNLLFTRPGAISNQIRTARAVSEGFSDPEALPTHEEVDREVLRDLVQREQITFPLGKDEEGQTIIGRGFGLPINTLLSTLSAEVPRSMEPTEIVNAAMDSIIRTGQKQVSGFSQIGKAVLELTAQKNFYFDRPLNEDFLRQVPQIAAIAEKLPAYEYTHVPAEILDSVTKKLLKGVDNGKGGYIVDPTMYYLLANLMPGVGRAINTANKFANPDLPISHAALHTLTGVRVEPQDAERNLAYEQLQEIQKNLQDRSFSRRKRNRREGISDE